MSTVDTSTWSPDSSLNTDIGGIPLNADASIQQTWQAIQMLMAALKGDTAAIELTVNQPDGTTIVATNQTLTVVDNAHAHTIANVTGLQTALNGKADESAVVHLTGAENISGSKTFSSLVSIINSTPRLSLNCPSNTIGGVLTSNDQSIYFRDKDGYNEGFIMFTCYPSTGGSVLSFCAFDCSTKTSQSRAQMSLEITTENSIKKAKFRPTTIGFIDLGDATYNFKDIYASNGTIQTSDERLKTSIEPFPDDILDAWGEVGFCQFQMRDAVNEKGADAARLHSGLVAQRIREAFAARGLDAARYGLFCHNEWAAREEARDADGNVVQPASESGDRYSLRYGECLCMEAAYQRRRADRLEARIAALEEAMNA